MTDMRRSPLVKTGAVAFAAALAGGGMVLGLDRIGGDGGTYFSPDGTPFSERALPPDRLNFDRNSYQIDTSNPLVRQGKIQIEESRIAPWFGQPGGGIQYRFFDGARELTAEQVKALGLLK